MISSTSDKIKVELRGHTALVTIDNPAANTWDTESLPALRDLVAELNAADSVYALVLTGAGEKFFSAGADLKLFADGDTAVAEEMGRLFGEAFEALADFRGVSIAAVNGFAMGGGLEVALACDLRVAVSEAKFFYPVMKLGFLPQPSDPARLTALIGPSRAKLILMAGQKIDAEIAHGWGLVDRLTTPETLMTDAQTLAADTRAATPDHAAAIKGLLR